MPEAVIDLEGLQALLDSLTTRGYTVFGPTVRDGAIVYDEIAGLNDLPAGVDRPTGRRHLSTHRPRSTRSRSSAARPSWVPMRSPVGPTIAQFKDPAGHLIGLTKAK